MYDIIRVERATQYWWTGSDWSNCREQAKLFKTAAQAWSEMKQRRIRRIVNVHERKPGRPPAAGDKPQVIVSVTMPPEYRDWLDRRGDRSEQVRKMIRRAMGEDI